MLIIVLSIIIHTQIWTFYSFCIRLIFVNTEAYQILPTRGAVNVSYSIIQSYISILLSLSEIMVWCLFSIIILWCKHLLQLKLVHACSYIKWWLTALWIMVYTGIFKALSQAKGYRVSITISLLLMVALSNETELMGGEF